MKLLLIRPPFAVEKFYFPRLVNESLGFEYLIAYLQKKHEIAAIDAVAEGWNNYWSSADFINLIFQGLRPNEILKKIMAFKPEVIGINWLFSTQNDSVRMVLKVIRQFNKTIPIVVGGPQPSANITDTLKTNPEIDVVVYGEGELTMQELLDTGFNNLEKIDGIAYRKNGHIVINQPRQLIENLDALPFPWRDLKCYENYSKQNIYRTVYLKLAKSKLPSQSRRFLSSKISALPFVAKPYYAIYNRRNKKGLPLADIYTSRGCPNHCTFCAIHNIWGHSWRARSAKNVLAEIDCLVSKFGIKHLNIQDDNFNVSKERVIEICQGVIANNYKLTILAPSGTYVPTLDEEVLTWLKKAGVKEIRMSIESGNQDILSNVIKKNINLGQVKQTVEICKKLGLYTEGAFIFGLPGESKETMRESLDFAKKAGFNRVIKFIFQPFPNTVLYDLCKKNNYLTPDYDPKKTYVTGNRCYVKTDKFTPDDVLKLVNRQES